MRARPVLLLVAIGTVLGALLLAGAPLAAGKGSHGTPTDRAATRAYLEAQLTYVRAQLASVSASLSAVQALDGSLASECPGVLTGAPRGRIRSIGSAREHRTPRQEGEEKRHRRQANSLQSELLEAIEVADLGPSREAAAALVRAIRPLRWSEAARTTLTQLSADSLEEDLGRTTPPVCSDMQAWVSSGYRTLSVGTKAIESSDKEQSARLVAALRQSGSLKFPGPLSRFEGPRERQLAKAISAAEAGLLKDGPAEIRAVEQPEVSLGLETQAESEESERPRTGSVEIGHGHTLAHTNFRVYVEPPETEPGPFGATVCRHPITVYAHKGNTETFALLEISSGGASEACVPASHAVVECEERVLTIELRTVAAARRVRLALSDGRRVSSPVSHITSKLGGPAGLYYQALNGPSPKPVKLEELGAHGRVLRTIALRPPRCPRPQSREPRSKTRTLASGTLPGGEQFRIAGTLTTYRGRKSFGLEAELLAEGLGGSSEASGEIGAIGGARRSGHAFAPELETGCRPAEFALVYGLLRKPHDVVLARTSNGLVALRKAKIPKALHAGGALAYVALGSVPQEVVVRTPTGRTVSSTNLAGKARDAREVCEGEAEG